MLKRLRWRPRECGLVAIIVAMVAAGCVGASGTSPGAVTTATRTEATPNSAWTIDETGPTPPGMPPLGPTAGLNQPPRPCQPSVPIVIAQPKMYEALAANWALGDQQQAGVGEVVTYDWGAHRPVAADSLRVTVPSLAWTLRSRVAHMRLVVATSDGVCFAQWRVAARPLAGYDGAQDAGSGWYLLGQGSAPTDATVVQGLPVGEWIVHVHLGYAAVDSSLSYSSESYVRIIVGDQLAITDPQAPAPDPAANCSGQSLAPGRNADAELTVQGVTGPTAGMHGTVSTGHGGAALPAAMPDPPIHMRSGSKLTVRTADGTCGNDWSGLAFLAVPDALGGPSAPESGLPTNDGADRAASTTQLIGAMNGLAPAPGEWLLTVTFWFGGPDAATYYWRISVS
jgi:hypothetical protein